MTPTMAGPLLTSADLEAMPEDGTRRWLVRGQLREEAMTYRNFRHAKAEARIAQLLGNWLDQQPQPRGELYDGDAGFQLRRDPDTVVGIDIAYVSPEVVAVESPDSTLIEGVPILAVEILSPSTTVEQMNEKLELYDEARVPVVWIVNPYNRTVTIHRPDTLPVMLNTSQTLEAEPHLPGFTVPVVQLFERSR